MSNARVVFFPLYVTNEEISFEELDEGNFNRMTCQEMAKQVFHPATIAKRLRQTLANTWMQIGTSKKEVLQIVKQHHFEHTYPHVYAVEAIIDKADLKVDKHNAIISFTEAALCKAKNFFPQKKHYVMNQNSNLLPDNVISISLVHSGEENPELVKHWKKNVDQINLPNYNSQTVVRRIAEYLQGSDWSAHTYSWRYITYPPGIKEMQSALRNAPLSLDELQEIALAQLPRQNLPGLFKRVYRLFNHYDDFTKDFYKAVISAKTLYDVVDWIDSKVPKQELSRLNRNTY